MLSCMGTEHFIKVKYHPFHLSKFYLDVPVIQSWGYSLMSNCRPDVIKGDNTGFDVSFSAFVKLLKNPVNANTMK